MLFFLQNQSLYSLLRCIPSLFRIQSVKHKQSVNVSCCQNPSKSCTHPVALLRESKLGAPRGPLLARNTFRVNCGGCKSHQRRFRRGWNSRSTCPSLRHRRSLNEHPSLRSLSRRFVHARVSLPSILPTGTGNFGRTITTMSPKFMSGVLNLHNGYVTAYTSNQCLEPVYAVSA